MHLSCHKARQNTSTPVHTCYVTRQGRQNTSHQMHSCHVTRQGRQNTSPPKYTRHVTRQGRQNTSPPKVHLSCHKARQTKHITSKSAPVMSQGKVEYTSTEFLGLLNIQIPQLSSHSFFSLYFIWKISMPLY